MSVDHVDTQSVIILFHVQCGPRRSQVVSGAGYRVMHPEKAGGLWAPLLMLYAEGTLGGSSFTMAQGEPMVPGMYTLSMHCGMGTHAPDAHCKFVLPVCPAYLPRIPKSS